MAMASIVMIPARMASTRLPGKVMHLINGQPMVWHVAERAIAADIGPVVICTPDAHVFDHCSAMGLHCALTGDGYQTGTDRIAAALHQLDPRQHYDLIINLQADVPTIDPKDIRRLVHLMDFTPTRCDLGTLCAIDTDPTFGSDPNKVKVIGTPLLSETPWQGIAIKALYFTRSEPWGGGPNYHHIGVYAYERAALERLQRLPQTPLERREGLEQLRALEYGMTIHAAIVDSIPLSVDTPTDLDRARESLDPAHHEPQDVHRNDPGQRSP